MIDIVTPALVVFESVVSSTLKNGIIDEEEFNTLQTLHLETLNELTGVNHAMEVEQVPSRKKPTKREKQYKEKHKNKSLMVSLTVLFHVLL